MTYGYRCLDATFVCCRCAIYICIKAIQISKVFNPEETNKLQKQVDELMKKGYVKENMSPCTDDFGS